MKIITALICFQFLSLNTVIAQSIPSFWSNIYNSDDYYMTHKGEIDEIIVSEIGYYASGESYKSKWVYKFISPYKCQGQLFKEGELNSYFVYELDSLQRIIKIEINTKIPLLGWEKSIQEYKFSGNKKTSEKHFDANNNVLRLVFYEYDSLDYLTKIRINDQFETAEYNYENNSYIYRVFNDRGEKQLEEVNFANKNSSENIKNEYDDPVYVVCASCNPKSNIFRSMKYKYDKTGNWVKKTKYLEKGSKREIVAKVRRKIKYKKKD